MREPVFLWTDSIRYALQVKKEKKKQGHEDFSLLFPTLNALFFSWRAALTTLIRLDFFFFRFLSFDSSQEMKFSSFPSHLISWSDGWWREEGMKQHQAKKQWEDYPSKSSHTLLSFSGILSSCPSCEVSPVTLLSWSIKKRWTARYTDNEIKGRKKEKRKSSSPSLSPSGYYSVILHEEEKKFVVTQEDGVEEKRGGCISPFSSPLPFNTKRRKSFATKLVRNLSQLLNSLVGIAGLKRRIKLKGIKFISHDV